LRVLVVNAGSSSLKVSVVDGDDRIIADREFESRGGRLDEAGLRKAIRGTEGIEAVGHRVVHGGARFRASIRIDADVVGYLGTITDLAPLHLPAAIAAIQAVGRLMPDLRAVACFDTAFHSRMPESASTYAIPREWRDRYGIKRYGFHGFSHAYASRRAAAILERPERELKVVTCHLGAGASLAAVAGGQSVDTTMGFTPLEGLVMATRSGTVDPGALLYLMRHAHMSEPELTDGLDRKGGLLAIAGSGDMREVLSRMADGDAHAQLAFDVFVHRLRVEIGSMAVSLDGLDALVFTGGIGQNSPEVRSAVVKGLGFLGAAIDEAANSSIDGDGDISTAQARVRTLVVRAREDIEVAREVRRVLSQPV
jgi:acetate kinase